MDEFKLEIEEQEKTLKNTQMRSSKRKQDLPQANKKNFEDEDARMGGNLNFLMTNSTHDQKKLTLGSKKIDKGMVSFSQTLGEKKKERQEKYLTVNGLLSHPYFIQINEVSFTIS